MVCFLLTTQNWLQWQRPLRNRKKWTWSRKFMRMPSIPWKDRENRSSRYCSRTTAITRPIQK